MIDITVNDKNISAAEEITLAVLLDSRKINRASVVVELNNRIVKRELFESQILQNGDRITILNFVGGG